MTDPPRKKPYSKWVKDPEEMKKFWRKIRASLSPQTKKMFDDIARGHAVTSDADQTLQTEIHVFAGAAASLIHCFKEAIRVGTDRNNYMAVPDDIWEADKHGVLNLIEAGHIKRIKMSDIESVPPEKQVLIVRLMIKVLESVVADERKRLS